MTAPAIRIVRIITRLNIGGPARQALLLTARLQGGAFRSMLVTGRPGAGEGELAPLEPLADGRQVVIPELQREPHPGRDAVAFLKLRRVLWRERPTVIHTHMAKAGTLGRLAGLLYNAVGPGRRQAARARLVHTFHGHVLEGYFPAWKARTFLMIERWLGRRTDRLIAVSLAIKEELLAMGIGSPSRWRVIPLGLDLVDLSRLPMPETRDSFKVGLVGRLVPIKNPTLFLEGIRKAMGGAGAGTRIEALVAGDGPLRKTLEAQARTLGLGQRVHFLGWQHDLASLYAELDAACVTSWNEGTPVALIEAMAAGRVAVATDVGGVRDLLDGGPAVGAPAAPGGFRVTDRGIIVRPGDADGLAAALRVVAGDAELRRRLGEAARRHVVERYTQDRLVADLAALYAEPEEGVGR